MDSKAGSLQTLMSFYCTTVVGADKNTLNPSQIPTFSVLFNVILLLTLIFETQNDDLELSDQCLENFVAAKIQEQDESSAEFKDLCESLMTEVVQVC